jgi:SPP1 gp7 family putative phage head morphogenesis protein
MAARRRRQLGQVPPATSNDALLDALIRHQIGLLRLSRGTGRQIREVLDDTEADLRALIRRRLRGQSGLETPASVERLDRLLTQIRQLRGEAHDDVDKLLVQEMNALAASEVRFIDNAVKTVLPVQIETTIPAAERLRAMVRTKPFVGKSLRDWAKSLRAADLGRIESQIRIGMVQGDNPVVIARRITGTVRLRGTNGVTEITRRDAEAIARTATNAVANNARQLYARENADIIPVELFVATLDGVTTPICRSLDGDRYPVDEGPQPPLHVNCRSLRVPLLDAEPLGRRPSKPTNERRLLREFAEQEGISPIPRRRAELPYGTKGAYDSFARARTRELIGRVPAKVTYEEWLGRQPAAFQDDVLGKTKGALFRRGDLPLDRFVDASGAEKTLAELARSDADAFRLAGLDPDDFR